MSSTRSLSVPVNTTFATAEAFPLQSASRGWLSRVPWRELLAELFGTALFAFIGISTIANTNNPIFTKGSPAALLEVALAHGLAIMVLVYVMGPVSGAQFNPAVTLGLVIGRKMSVLKGIAYWIMQFAGATMGASFVLGLSPEAKESDRGALGTFQLGIGVSLAQGLGIEIVLTFLLMLVIWGVAVEPTKRPGKGETEINFAYAGLCIGLTVCIDILAGGPVTGACMNPARHFGPSLVASQWTAWWIFYVGPCIGAAAATLFYTLVISPTSPLAPSTDDYARID